MLLCSSGILRSIPSLSKTAGHSPRLPLLPFSFVPQVTEMLKRILPLSVVQRLQQGQSMIADAHDEVTVLFAVGRGFDAASH
jgi:hypothetical protein